ncbi:MAG: hypothetical protein ACT6QS_10690 [Flavobacteriales bacterium]
MKKTLFILFLCATALSLQAQYAYKNDSLGIRAEFPCQPREERRMQEGEKGQEEEYVILCEQEQDMSAFTIFIRKMGTFEASKHNIEQYLLEAKEDIAQRFPDVPLLSQKMQATESSGEMRFQVRSKEFNANFWLQCRNGYMVRIIYITDGRPDEAAWTRFSGSFKTDW